MKKWRIDATFNYFEDEVIEAETRMDAWEQFINNVMDNPDFYFNIEVEEVEDETEWEEDDYGEDD